MLLGNLRRGGRSTVVARLGRGGEWRHWRALGRLLREEEGEEAGGGGNFSLFYLGG
jgi:hypothetical protein